MKVLILQHQDSVTAGTTIEWLEKKHHDYQIHFFSEGNLDPEITYDLLIICGGSANVDQELEFPWLIEEKKFIKSAIEKNKNIVGLCLGGQLLAEILGGKVFKASHWETGWHKVKLLDEKKEMVFYQWHGYQFISPPGSAKFAENTACPHQAFKLGKNILAFQFHPESSVEWVEECALDPEKIEGEKYMQDGPEIMEGLKYHDEMKAWYFKQLDMISTKDENSLK